MPEDIRLTPQDRGPETQDPWSGGGKLKGKVGASDKLGRYAYSLKSQAPPLTCFGVGVVNVSCDSGSGRAFSWSLLNLPSCFALRDHPQPDYGEAGHLLPCCSCRGPWGGCRGWPGLCSAWGPGGVVGIVEGALLEYCAVMVALL